MEELYEWRDKRLSLGGVKFILNYKKCVMQILLCFPPKQMRGVVNKVLLNGTVLVNKKLLTGTVLVDKNIDQNNGPNKIDHIVIIFKYGIICTKFIFIVYLFQFNNTRFIYRII